MPFHPVSRQLRRVRGVLLAGLLAVLLLPVARADADAYQAVEQAYATSPSQTIPPCRFSSAELAAAESSVPNDSQQYNPGLVSAIELALQQRADGDCAVKKRAGAGANVPVGTPVPPPGPRLGPGSSLRVGSTTASTDAGAPAPVVILAVLAGVGLLIGGVLGVARLRGWDPRWLARSRHSWDEAGYRVSGMWSNFGGRGRSPRRSN